MTALSRFPALQAPQLRIYIAGAVFALNGLWIQRVVMGWLAWSLTGSATWVGIVAFLMFAPTMVSGPFFGVLTDRVDVRRAALTSQSILAGFTLCLAVTELSGLLGIWSLSAIALGIGITTSAHHPIRGALVPRLVPREALANAVALVSINFNLARLLGPAIGGALIAGLGVSAAILVNVACFLPFLAALFMLRPRPRAEREDHAERGSFLRELGDGVRHVLEHPSILRAMALNGLFSSIVRGSLEILPAVADGRFQRGADGLGEILAAAGAGALVASAVMAWRNTHFSGRGLPPVSTTGVFAGFIFVAGLGYTDVWGLALLCTFGIGCTGAVVGIGYMSTVQLILEDGFRGRVMSLWTVVGIGGAAVGALCLGQAVDRYGLEISLVTAAAAAIFLAGLVLAASRPKYENR